MISQKPSTDKAWFYLEDLAFGILKRMGICCRGPILVKHVDRMQGTPNFGGTLRRNTGTQGSRGSGTYTATLAPLVSTT